MSIGFSGWVIIKMAMVVVDDSGLKQADSQPKSCGLVWGSAAAWRCSTFTRWTEWTLAMTWSWWQHYKHRRGYYYYYYYFIRRLFNSDYFVISAVLAEECALRSAILVVKVAEVDWKSKVGRLGTFKSSTLRLTSGSSEVRSVIPVQAFMDDYRKTA